MVGDTLPDTRMRSVLFHEKEDNPCDALDQNGVRRSVAEQEAPSPNCDARNS